MRNACLLLGFLTGRHEIGVCFDVGWKVILTFLCTELSILYKYTSQVSLDVFTTCLQHLLLLSLLQDDLLPLVVLLRFTLLFPIVVLPNMSLNILFLRNATIRLFLKILGYYIVDW